MPGKFSTMICENKYLAPRMKTDIFKHLVKLSKLVLIAGFIYLPSGDALPDDDELFYSPPVPLPGTEFHYSCSNGRKSETISDDTSPFKGRAVYRIIHEPYSSNWALTAWDAETHNLVAVFNKSGKLLRYYEPHESEFFWPMQVGKTNKTKFKQHILIPTRGRVQGVYRKSGVVTVAAKETITTRIGAFETMRVDVEVQGWRRIRIWYARDIPRPVRHNVRDCDLTEIRTP